MQIFLAHASEDKPQVMTLYDKLKSAGYQPWLDKKNLIPGQNWRNEIPKAIRNSDIFLACLSSRSVSKRGYIQKEFKLALDVYAEMPSEAIFIIPLRFDDCDIPDLQSEYGGKLRDIHWLDYWESDGFELLVMAVEYAKQLGGGEDNPSNPSPVKEGARETDNLVEMIEEKAASNEQTQSNLKAFSFEIVTVNRKGEINNRENRQAQYFIQDINGVSLEMVYVPGGTFLMGTEDEEIERLCKKYEVEYFRWEKPQHQVTVPPFFMGKYPITQQQWKAVASLSQVERELELEPSRFKDSPSLPVERVSWYDAVEFCQRLSKLAQKDYRLPSEAEWEYGCRACRGERPFAPTPFYFGETITSKLANYNGNYTYAEELKGEYREKTTPVGQFPPNAFGLYDMHGNVWEWCADTWHDNYEGATTDGSAWLNNDNHSRLLRGGSWYYDPWYCRCASRIRFEPDYRNEDIGFRVVCVART